MFYLNSERSESGRQCVQQKIRDVNLKQIFNLIHEGKAKSRVELVHATGLSPAAVSSLTEMLIHDHIATEVGPNKEHRGGGRKPILLQINPHGAQIPVFCIGPLGVEYTLYDLTCNVIEKKFRPYLLEREKSSKTFNCGSIYSEIIRDILLNQSEQLVCESIPAILLCFPGVRLLDAGVLLLTGLDVTIPISSFLDLEAELNIPIFAGNTSIALAYAEKKLLDAEGTGDDDLIYINICSGVGSGIIRNGQPVGRSGGFPGEIGHMTIQMNGRSCPCGNKGCLERYVSIGAIIDEVRQAVANDTSGMYANTLRDLLLNTTPEKIGQAYTDGIIPVREALDRIAARLCAGIYSVVNVTGIRYIALGGIRMLGEKYLQKLDEILKNDGKCFLMKDVTLCYSKASEGDESLGIAKYYIDNQFVN